MQTKKIQFVPFTGDSDLEEIYQISRLRFAFLSAPRHGSKQCHPWVLCRDFLHDAVKAQLTKEKIEIYKFLYSEKNPPIDTRAMRMMVNKTDVGEKYLDEWDAHMDNALKLIHHYEGLDGSPKSTCYRIKYEDNEVVWLFTGPAFWMKTPYLISLYTMLIRLGLRDIQFDDNKGLKKALKAIADKKAKYGDNDIKYLKTCWNKLDLIMANKKAIFGTGWDKIFLTGNNKHDFHDFAGIVSLCNNKAVDRSVTERFNKVLAAASK